MMDESPDDLSYYRSYIAVDRDNRPSLVMNLPSWIGSLESPDDLLYYRSYLGQRSA